MTAASATVKAGSTADTMLAVEGPTSSRPRKKVVMARIVEISTSPASAAQAPAPNPVSNCPVIRVKLPTEIAAPVTTIAVSQNGSASATTVWATRM